MAALLEEVQLYETNEERARNDSLADLYSVVSALQYLEKAHIKAYVSGVSYNEACSNLIRKYKSAFEQVQGKEFPTIRSFMSKYKIDFRLALQVIEKGEPKSQNMFIIDCTNLFVDVSDLIKLESVACDQLQLPLKDLYDNMNRMSILSKDAACVQYAHKWLKIFNKMSASDVLSNEDIRQLSLDNELAFNDFRQQVAKD